MASHPVITNDKEAFLRGFFSAVRLLTGARRHFENATITLTLRAFAPTGSAYIVEIIIIDRIQDDAIQCLGHSFILEPRHSPERKDRIAAHFGDIRTGT